MAKHPGTSGLMPVKGSSCGIRPDPEALEITEGFDFSGAADLLTDVADDDKKNVNENGSAESFHSDTATKENTKKQD
ncbi:MAG: hypothetical protein VB954_13450 [Thalassolituus sp.]|jgi:hypothetical protein|uniref:hypothetical protein n=1 Tax=Thalassolituus sp. TaxID=2030822 RepID=UPI0039822F69